MFLSSQQLLCEAALDISVFTEETEAKKRGWGTFPMSQWAKRTESYVGKRWILEEFGEKEGDEYNQNHMSACVRL